MKKRYFIIFYNAVLENGEQGAGNMNCITNDGLYPASVIVANQAKRLHKYRAIAFTAITEVSVEDYKAWNVQPMATEPIRYYVEHKENKVMPFRFEHKDDGEAELLDKINLIKEDGDIGNYIIYQQII